MKRYLGYAFKPAVETIIRKVAANIGVTVRSIIWDKDVQTAGINHAGRIYLADVADDAVLYDIDVQRYAGFAVHELLHRKYTDFDQQSDNGYIRAMHNAVEDAWIEHTGINANLTGNIGGLLSALIDQMVGEAMLKVNDWTDPKQYPFIFAVYLRTHSQTYVPIPAGLDWIIHEACNRVLLCRSSRDTLGLAEWIVAQLRGLPQGNEQSKGQGQGEGQGQSSQPGKTGDKVADNPHQSPGNARAPSERQKAVEVEPSLDAPQGKGGGGSWSEVSYLRKTQDANIKPWINDAPAIPGKLRFEVKRLFDDSGIHEFQKNRRSGAINVNALHKLDITDKVFQRRHDVDGIDSAVVICLDVSGSMFDEGTKSAKHPGVSERIINAVLTCNAMVDTLSKAQVATSVLTFGSTTAVAKPFDMNATKAIARLNAVTEGGGTNDYFAVRYAHKLLLNRPEQRKICFVITDGMGREDLVQQQVKIGERLGITTIGIGIQEDVAHVYPQSVRVNNIGDLGTVSFKQIKLAA